MVAAAEAAAAEVAEVAEVAAVAAVAAAVIPCQRKIHGQLSQLRLQL
jgi:hypothetical protein